MFLMLCSLQLFSIFPSPTEKGFVTSKIQVREGKWSDQWLAMKYSPLVATVFSLIWRFCKSFREKLNLKSLRNRSLSSLITVCFRNFGHGIFPFLPLLCVCMATWYKICHPQFVVKCSRKKVTVNSLQPTYQPIEKNRGLHWMMI